VTVERASLSLKDHLPKGAEIARCERDGLSSLARGLVGSEILKIADEIRAIQAGGGVVCNLTVGDFSPAEFRIPDFLEAAIAEAMRSGETNYPPSDGIPALRQAVLRFYERELGLSYPLESVLIAGGSRPLIYATYKAILDPGETVVYPVPSWNNNHYAFLTGARAREIVVSRATNFLPTAAAIAPVIAGARLLCINSPLNPTGTVLSRDEIGAIATLVVEENVRRARSRERSLYLMLDQVYWMLTFGAARHHTPPELVPGSGAWTILIDGISKAFAATGLRVGWSLAPPYLTARMRDILGHVGAWAPRPAQVATARLLDEPDAVADYHRRMIGEVRARLDDLFDGIRSMALAGLPVDSVPPQGAIYLSVRFDLVGRRFNGETLRSNDAVRKLLLQEAGFAVVPFNAFGLSEETGWMRLSVGTVSRAGIAAGLGRVRSLLERIEK
jgi:aspartate aminotransferase